ncbi:MAG: DUF3789 domain-containing protein [Hominisplanchenecus sp.]
MSFVTHFLAFAGGSLFGVFCMCLLQANRLNK